MTRVLVTGGGGFVGSAVVRMLLERGDTVRTLARGSHATLDGLDVEARRGDLADPDAVDRAVAGCDLVVHAGARAGAWGPRAEYSRTNVEGTRNVVRACRAAGVGRLVHTSSPSVVHGGADLAGVDESRPYPARHDAPYPATKALAERLVLAANGPDLATVALRPHLVWGPGDTQLGPRIVARARAGRLRLVGDGGAIIDTTYVENAAEAHLLAADRLAPGAPCAGRAYFIAQGEPLPVRRVVDRLLAAHGLPPVTATVPFPVAYGLGAAAEGLFGLLRLRREPPMTRFLARQLTTAHWFDLTAARRDLGYGPRISFDEGMVRLARHVQASR